MLDGAIDLFSSECPLVKKGLGFCALIAKQSPGLKQTAIYDVGHVGAIFKQRGFPYCELVQLVACDLPFIESARTQRERCPVPRQGLYKKAPPTSSEKSKKGLNPAGEFDNDDEGEEEKNESKNEAKSPDENENLNTFVAFFDPFEKSAYDIIMFARLVDPCPALKSESIAIETERGAAAFDDAGKIISQNFSFERKEFYPR